MTNRRRNSWHSDAQSAGVLLNVVDRPGLCDFIVPAVMEQGDLVIATSTGGASPALAKRIRRDLQESFGPEYAEALRLLRRVRERLAARWRARPIADAFSLPWRTRRCLSICAGGRLVQSINYWPKRSAMGFRSPRSAWTRSA